MRQYPDQVTCEWWTEYCESSEGEKCYFCCVLFLLYWQADILAAETKGVIRFSNFLFTASTETLEFQLCKHSGLFSQLMTEHYDIFLPVPCILFIRELSCHPEAYAQLSKFLFYSNFLKLLQIFEGLKTLSNPNA